MPPVTREPKHPVEKLIAYYRVSTAEQGRSGLGLEAQESAVERHAVVCNGQIIARYKEVESGKHADRPELAKAIGHARRAGAKLVIAKLDRLARNVHLVAGLMESKVDFVCCDNPHATPLTIHILAAMAEHERKEISARTKAALAATKARGTKLGSHRPGFWHKGRKAAWIAGLPVARARSAAVRRANAAGKLADVLPLIREQRQSGKTLQSIADMLNKQGNGRRWYPASVRHALTL